MNSCQPEAGIPACWCYKSDVTDQSNIGKAGVGGPAATQLLAANPDEEDASTQRRRLAAVWLAAGSAVAFMVGMAWYNIVRAGGLPPGSDLVGHAAAAEWLRTLPWWDWRGWSDWFYGGQAIGVNYPPLSHAWMRFTHPVHGQMAAVALGLLVLLPLGALRLARAVGYPPRLQRIAVGAVLVLATVSGAVFAFLPGFDSWATFFGSWPAMLAVVTGLFTAAWAACCHRPIAAGAVAGVALLCNSTMIPGWIVIWAILLATSGASFRQATRWAFTTGATALVISAWWVVPFLASWDRLVPWKVPLYWHWLWSLHPIVLTVWGLGAAWAARHSGPARRLAGSAAMGLGATLLVDWLGWLRPERWAGPALLIAAISCAGLASSRRLYPTSGHLRPVWKLHALLGIIVVAVFVRWIEILPIAAGLFLLPVRSWAWIGGLAWTFTLYWGGLWGPDSNVLPTASSPLGVAVQGNLSSEGSVYFDSLNLAHSMYNDCTWNHPWEITKSTEGRVRPLSGVYRETSSTLEFISSKFLIGTGFYGVGYPNRSHWLEAWQTAGTPQLGESAAAEALGARWYASCDENGVFSVIDLAGITASGVTVAFYPSEDSWHRAAARWWISISAGFQAEPELWEPVPIWSETSVPGRPASQAASGVVLRSDGDRLTIGARAPGWAWLRVPWDPFWGSPSDTAVHKGGPGQLVVWVPEGGTELVWRVPAAVDTAAAVVTAAAGVLVLIMTVTNRHQDQERDLDRPRPVRAAVDLYADTVDEWLRTASRRARREPNTTRPPPKYDRPDSVGGATNPP